jgi:hypothetical protein
MIMVMEGMSGTGIFVGIDRYLVSPSAPHPLSVVYADKQ